MSPRRNRTTRNADRETSRPPVAGSARRVEDFRGEDWIVQDVTGSAGRFYRCPGCDQEIPSGVGHVVAWPDHGGGLEDRRHWHRACWSARERRAANLLRGRGAPRF